MRSCQRPVSCGADESFFTSSSSRWAANDHPLIRRARNFRTSTSADPPRQGWVGAALALTYPASQTARRTRVVSASAHMKELMVNLQSETTPPPSTRWPRPVPPSARDRAVRRGVHSAIDGDRQAGARRPRAGRRWSRVMSAGVSLSLRWAA